MDKDTTPSEYTALIVEDDTFILDLLVYKFKSHGWKVVSAMDGETCMEKVTETKPNIILLDILLPGINGYEVLERLKADEKLKDIPVLILSNYGQQEEVDRSKELGAVDHLIKANIIIEDVISRAEEIGTAGNS